MTEHRPIGAAATATNHSDDQHDTHRGTHRDHHRDYLPAAGRDAFLPFYDLLTAALGVPKIHRTLIGQAGLADGQDVLEIGCGTGNLLLRARRAAPGARLVGLDPDPLALARARRKARRLDGVRFEQGYAQRLPFADAAFDRVLSALMLHHLDREAKPAAAAELLRVLRPGGSLHVVDFAGPKNGTSGLHGLHGLLSRRVAASGHAHSDAGGEGGGEGGGGGDAGDGIPELLATAGFAVAEVAARPHPVMGRVAYYRATRPL